MWPLLAQASGDDSFRNTIDSLARTPLSVVLEWVSIITVIRIVIYFAQKDVLPHRRSGSFAVGRIVSELIDAIVYAGVFVFMIIRPFFIQAFLIPSGSMVSTLRVNDFIVANKAVYRYSNPKEGDIVVFRPPKRACFPYQLDKNGEVNVDFIKRCIGVPGDVIEVRNLVLYRNGKPVDEPYKHFTAEDPPNQVITFRELSPDEVKNPDLNPPINFKLVNFNGQFWPVDYDNETINSHGWVAPEYQVDDDLTMQKLRSLPPAAIPPGYYLFMGDNRNGSYDGRAWGLVPRESIIGRSEVIWLPINHWGTTDSSPGVSK